MSGIKFGCCLGITVNGDDVSINNLEIIANSGYDYVELQACTLASLSEIQCEKLKEELTNNRIGALVANVAYPGGIFLVGDDVDYKKIRDYLSNMFAKLEFMGIKKLVFGSGGARKIPEGFSEEKAGEQLEIATKMMSEIAQNHGVLIVIEPLNKKETNVFNSVTEACEFAKKVNLNNVQVLCDYYHMAMDEENVESITKIKNFGVSLEHVHIANPVGRVFPTENENYDEFFAALKSIGYDKTISVEASTENIQNDCIMSLNLLKKAGL